MRSVWDLDRCGFDREATAGVGRGGGGGGDGTIGFTAGGTEVVPAASVVVVVVISTEVEVGFTETVDEGHGALCVAAHHPTLGPGDDATNAVVRIDVTQSIASSASADASSATVVERQHTLGAATSGART